MSSSGTKEARSEEHGIKEDKWDYMKYSKKEGNERKGGIRLC